MKQLMVVPKHFVSYVLIFIVVFFIIGLLTTVKPTKRLSHTLYTSWTNQLEKESYLEALQAENTLFSLWLADKEQENNWYKAIWSTFSLFPDENNIRLLGSELPGFSTYENQVIIANESVNDWHYLTSESGPPLELVLLEREAIDYDDHRSLDDHVDGRAIETFIYSSHNRESFLPHLPDEKEVDHAYHEEVNITKVSKRVAQLLNEVGIGAIYDETDIMKELENRGWNYGRSYDVSREVVQDAMGKHGGLQYFFDIHRDSIGRDLTTVEIDHDSYASILFVIGAEHKNYEQNLQLARNLHERLNESYPNISRGVITKEGANANGIYNQDLNDQAILIEFGGYDNTLDEMYMTAEAFVDVFYQFYTETVKVNQLGE